jgi:peptidoglycan hydrolase CwlO-like protein
MNIHTATALMLCLATLTTNACVTRSTHNVAVADLEATKAELSSTTTQSQVLTEQVSELQQHRLDIARQIDAASSGFRQAAQQREAERAALQKRLSRLSHTISQLTAQQNSLRYALQGENKAQPRLQVVVERLRSQLDKADGPEAPVSPPSVNHTDQPVETAPPGQVVAQTVPVPKPTMMTPAAPANPTAANPTPQPANKQPSEPVEQDWLSWLKEWVFSFLQSIFP